MSRPVDLVFDELPARGIWAEVMTVGPDGVFVDGACERHIYTNGVAEEDNPIPIAAVVDALKAEVEKRINVLRRK